MGLLGLAAASLLSGAGPALCSSFAGSSEDEFTPSEEYSSADDAARPSDRHEKAYNRNLENSRKRRADQRGGADPTPAGERHLSHQDQHAKEVSADAVIAACKFQCNCGFANCVQPSVELVETCRTRKYETKRGPWLGDIVRNAAVRGPDGALRLDKKTCVIPIGNGLVACWRRFNSIFAVKEKMQSKLVTYAQAAIPPASLWSDHVMRLKRDVAPKRECAQEWIRAWAQHVGCFMPNGTNAIHVDATQLKTVWKLYNHETPQTQTSYPHFTKAYNTEKDIPPVIRQRKKKDVSSPCLDCVRLNELLGKALDDKNTALVAAVKAKIEEHFQVVRAERIFQCTIARQSQNSTPPHMSLVWDMMDQSKLHLPGWKGALKQRTAGRQRCVMRLMGCTDHGSGRWFAFAAPPWVPKGGNLTCTTLYLALRELQRRNGGKLPRVLKVRTRALRRRRAHAADARRCPSPGEH